MTAPALTRWTRPQLEHAVRLAERQRDAVFTLHRPCHVPDNPESGLTCRGHGPTQSIAARCVHCVGFPYPCPTVRAFGVDTTTEKEITP